MNIKPILMRLQTALGQQGLMEQMLLIHKATSDRPNEGANFVIGYNGSPNSLTALDFILWMAHQTRLATQKPVTVHVVYVIDQTIMGDRTTGYAAAARTRSTTAPWDGAIAASVGTAIAPAPSPTLLEHADQILWQARCLAEEWRGSLEVHLRFGNVAEQLNHVVSSVAADLLFVGCSSADHALIQGFQPEFPCSVIGIPTQLEALA